MRPTYDTSFAILKGRIGIIGEPRPMVTRPPRHDDEDLGPAIFRSIVKGVSLDELTLPGLYVGRSDLTGISFRRTDLRLAAFNWSDLFECDFTGADLTAADIRACCFVRCVFRSADLSDADLRGSSFDACTFDGAIMRHSKLHRRRRVLGLIKVGPDQTDLPLSAAQRQVVEWSSEVPPPGGG
jgi:hypothetical protein